MKRKVFTENSLNALVASTLRIKGAAEANTSAVSGLGEDLQGFARQTTEKLKEVVDRLTELDKEDSAADEEVTEMLDEVFGTSGGQNQSAISGTGSIGNAE